MRSSVRESFYPVSPHIDSNQSYCWGTHPWLDWVHNAAALLFGLVSGLCSMCFMAYRQVSLWVKEWVYDFVLLRCVCFMCGHKKKNMFKCSVLSSKFFSTAMVLPYQQRRHAMKWKNPGRDKIDSSCSQDGKWAKHWISFLLLGKVLFCRPITNQIKGSWGIKPLTSLKFERTSIYTFKSNHTSFLASEV